MIGLVNRMRLFAPPNVVSGAEAVIRAIVEIALKPSIELRQLAKEALSKSPKPDPLLAFSEICRADLDGVRRSAVSADCICPNLTRVRRRWRIQRQFAVPVGRRRQ